MEREESGHGEGGDGTWIRMFRDRFMLALREKGRNAAIDRNYRGIMAPTTSCSLPPCPLLHKTPIIYVVVDIPTRLHHAHRC
jgi:hypothetical protein